MTPQEAAINWIRLNIDNVKFDPSTGEEVCLNDYTKKVIEALEMVIEALSKQSASSEQDDKSLIVDFVAFQREWLKTHKIMKLNSADEVMTEIFLEETGKAFIDSLDQSAKNDEAKPGSDQIANDSKMVDQFLDTTKKTEDVPDTNVEKIPYKKPGIIQCKDCLLPPNECEGTGWFKSDCSFHSKAERRNDG